MFCILISCNNNVKNDSNQVDDIEQKEHNYRIYFNEYINALSKINDNAEVVSIMSKYYFHPEEINKHAFEAMIASEGILALKLKNVDSLTFLFNDEIDEWFDTVNGYYDTLICDCNAVIILNKDNIAEYCFKDGKIYSSLGIYDPKLNTVAWIRELYTKEEMDSLGLEGK